MEVFQMNDVYAIMNASLQNSDYQACELDERKNIVNKAMIDYFSFKITQLHIAEPYSLDNDILSIYRLIEEHIEPSRRLDVLCHPVHYVLGLISLIQGWEVVWEIDDSIDPSSVKFTGEGKLDTIKTCKNPNMGDVFSTIWNYYMQIQVLKQSSSDYKLGK